MQSSITMQRRWQCIESRRVRCLEVSVLLLHYSFRGECFLRHVAAGKQERGEAVSAAKQAAIASLLEMQLPESNASASKDEIPRGLKSAVQVEQTERWYVQEQEEGHSESAHDNHRNANDKNTRPLLFSYGTSSHCLGSSALLELRPKCNKFNAALGSQGHEKSDSGGGQESGWKGIDRGAGYLFQMWFAHKDAWKRTLHSWRDSGDCSHHTRQDSPLHLLEVWGYLSWVSIALYNLYDFVKILQSYYAVWRHTM